MPSFANSTKYCTRSSSKYCTRTSSSSKLLELEVLEVKGKYIEKEEVKLFLCEDNTISYVERPKESAKISPKTNM